MAVRQFTDSDTAQIWTLLNEIGAEVNRTQSVILGGMKIAVGRYQLDLPASPVNATGAISFGTTFSSPPVVTFSVATGGGGTDKVIVRLNDFGVTTTSIPVYIQNNAGGAIPSFRITWQAIGAA